MKAKHERHWKRLLVGAACAAAALAVAGCASAPQAASSSEYQPDKPLPVEIHEPFEEFLRDTKDVFRARASAEAMSAQAAQKAAEINAKVSLAGKIKTTIDSMAITDVENGQADASITTTMNFRERAKAMVEQTLYGVSVVGQKTYRDPSDGRYIVYVAIELDRKNAAESVARAAKLSPAEKQALLTGFEKFDEAAAQEAK